jgi:hypothetical protein
MIKNRAGEIVHYLPPTEVRDSHHYMWSRSKCHDFTLNM